MKILPIASPLHDPEAIAAILNELREHLKGFGVELLPLITSPNIAVPSDAVLFVLTGGTEHIVLDVSKRLGRSFIVYHDRYNSLPAVIESISLLRELGIPFIVMDVNLFKEKIAMIGRVFNALEKLRRRFRLGVVEGVSPWLVYSVSSTKDLERVGFELVYIPMKELIEEYNSVDVETHRNELKRILERVKKIEVEESVVVNAYKLYIALKNIVSRLGLDGITLKCFDIIHRIKTTACLALSILNSEGVVAVCEGDIPIAVSMALGYPIYGSPGFMANVNMVSENRMILSHCAVPLSIVEEVELTTHFESGIGVGIRGIRRNSSKGVLFRLSRDLRKARVIEVEIAKFEPVSEHLCRTQVVVEGQNLDVVVREPLGNHYALFIDADMEPLIYLLNLLGIEVEMIPRKSISRL